MSQSRYIAPNDPELVALLTLPDGWVPPPRIGVFRPGRGDVQLTYMGASLLTEPQDEKEHSE